MNKINSWFNKQFLVFLLLTIFLSPLGYAEENSLYVVEQPIVKTGFSQSKCLTEAFQEVLVRVSGTEAVLKDRIIQQALQKTDKYVKQFSYHQRPDAQRFIKVVFNETLMNELLKTNTSKLSVWQKKRPLTLVWLVVNKENVLSWVGSDSEVGCIQDLEKALKRHGIPFVFPLLDLTDTAQITEKDVENKNIELLQENAKRYNAEAILIGRLNQSTTDWQLNWTLVIGGATVTFELANPELKIALEESAEHLASRMMEQSIQTATVEQSSDRSTDQFQTIQSDFKTTSKSNHLILTVMGISNAEHYNKVSEYLRGLPFVVQVEVEQVQPEKTIFNIKVTCEKEEIVKSIADGLILTKVSTEANNELDNNKQEFIYKVTGESI